MPESYVVSPLKICIKIIKLQSPIVNLIFMNNIVNGKQVGKTSTDREEIAC